MLGLIQVQHLSRRGTTRYAHDAIGWSARFQPRPLLARGGCPYRHRLSALCGHQTRHLHQTKATPQSQPKVKVQATNSRSGR
jgi:hypothetical protein